MQLEGKVAAVTGASSGIGKEIALAFAREGAAVAAGYRSNPDGARDAVQQIENSEGRAAAVWSTTLEWSRRCRFLRPRSRYGGR